MNVKQNFPLTSLTQYAVDSPLTFCHDTFDILCILSGSIKIALDHHDARTYQHSDVLIIHPNQSASFSSNEENEILHMCLLPSFIEKYLGTDSIIFCDSTLEPNRSYLAVRRLISNISWRYHADGPVYDLSLYSLLFELLDLLKREYTLNLPLSIEYKNEKQKERSLEIQDYIRQNYNQPITLTTLAEHLHLSVQYLSKVFKDCFHMKFSEYVNLLRIQHAEHDLRYSDESVTDIALNHGFANAATFNKYFRTTHGCSPKEYRKNSQLISLQDKETPQINERNVYLNTDIEKEERNITVDCSTTTAFSQNLCSMINIGFAKTLLSVSFQEQLTRTVRELPVKYVRIEGLISNAMIPRLADQNGFYFASIEQSLNLLQHLNLIPFIELGKNSYNYLQNNSNQWIFRGYSTNKKFHLLLEAFLKYVTTYYEPTWYNQWIFELWNPPAEPLDTYIEGYKIMKNLILTYIPSVKFGGPGHNTGLPSTDFLDYLELFVKNQITPDFISVHMFTAQYLLHEQTQKLIRLLDPNIFSIQVSWMKRKIKQIFGHDIPLYITEYNSSLIPGSYINNSCYQAAFLCHNLLAVHKQAPLSGYWMLADTLSNIESPESYHINGIGLITGNQIRTPGYYAFRLLSKLGTRLIEQGDNYCITQTDEKNYQIISWHCVPFSSSAFLSNAEEHSLRNMYKHYEHMPPLQMTFHLNNIPSGTYRIKRYLLDRFHGSYLDIRLGELINGNIDEETFLYEKLSPLPEDMNYLLSACVPEERALYMQVEHTLTVTSPIYPHNVCLWEITNQY